VEIISDQVMNETMVDDCNVDKSDVNQWGRSEEKDEARDDEKQHVYIWKNTSIQCLASDLIILKL
jgi:hypothetical protein